MFIAYFFRASKLQAYIFATGKLRDAVGASFLIDQLARPLGNDLIGNACKEAGVQPVLIARRAAGTIALAFQTESLEKVGALRAVFRLLVAQTSPGLQFSDGLGQDATADIAIEAARQLAEQSPAIETGEPPPGGPFSQYASRTGAPAIISDSGTLADGRCRITHDEFVDASTVAKRRALEQGALTVPKLFTGRANEFHWPLDVEADGVEGQPHFSFANDDRSIGAVHIDGNDVGALYHRVAVSCSPAETTRFSSDLAAATQRAAAIATECVLSCSTATQGDRPVAQMRPLILGGDDISVLVRGDIALEFTTIYQRAFEAETRQLFNDLRAKGFPADLPESGLKTKAGVVFVKPRQPFSLAYELCEELSKSAKVPDENRVSFYRVEGSVIPQNAMEAERKSERNGVTWWTRSWSTTEGGGFDNLLRLRDAIGHEDVGRGPLRQTPERISIDRENGLALYRRALRVVEQRSPSAHLTLLDALKGCGIETPEQTPFRADGSSPLLDAIRLEAITRRSEQRVEAA